ncbi:hypothetical protein FRB94_013393 [Tulasnella sp. JGI-2019a]|nr:hypothetical protein FRB94_013393 [Tulasnella sp. JGI-2019a]
MSQVINTRLGRMKDALSENTPDALQLKGLWQDLLVCIDAPTDDGVDQWIKLSSSGIVTSAINLLMTAIDRDSTGVSGVYAVELANRCAMYAWDALPYLMRPVTAPCRYFSRTIPRRGLSPFQHGGISSGI